MWSRIQLDNALPTVVRYIGLVLTIILTFALVLGHTEVTPGFVPAAGLLLYKTVMNAAEEEPK
ncbi:MAG: hypothetical protein H0U59_04270 [Gemmatimonadaceae bacterium]|nr:hypothetical protein [Gemmatimonadaceae bacterium]